MKIGLIAYRGGNVRSIQSALESLGVEVIYSRSPDQLQACKGLIFPGVGAAASALSDLQAGGLHTWIPTWPRPFLGICLGMQLLCAHTEEGDVPALGIFPLRVQRLQNAPRIPHIGWNAVQICTEDPLFAGIPSGSYFYFVHSYGVPLSDYAIGQTQYGEAFCAALRRDNFWGVQFHPEKSSQIGLKLLANFLEICSS